MQVLTKVTNTRPKSLESSFPACWPGGSVSSSRQHVLHPILGPMRMEIGSWAAWAPRSWIAWLFSVQLVIFGFFLAPPGSPRETL